jgi:hypothetical protein
MGEELSEVLNLMVDMMGKIISGILSQPATAAGFLNGSQKANAETQLGALRESVDRSGPSQWWLAEEGNGPIRKYEDGISETKAGDI